MLLSLAELIWSEQGLNGPVLVEWGTVTGPRPDLVAAAANTVHIFAPGDSQYFLSASFEAETEVLSLAVGLPAFELESIIVGLEDRVTVYGVRQGRLVRLWETDREPEARFVDLILADLDGDGRDEIIAAAETREALYIYRLTGETAEEGLDLLAIRILPGPARKVTVLAREGETPVIAAAYDSGETSGITTLLFTELGFQEGPSLDNLPVRLSSLTAGDLGPRPGEELAWGGTDGAARVVELNGELLTVLTTDNLGSDIPALTAGRLTGEGFETLLAGTPEGYIFGFTAPVEQSSPTWAVQAGRPANDLSVSAEGLLGVGTADGAVQVWLLSAQGRRYHVVRPGETLSGIAKLYGVSAAALAVANRLADPDLILPGRNLLIP